MKALSSCLGLLCLLASVCAVGQEAGGDAEFADYQIRLFRSEKMFSSVRQGRVQRVRDLRGFTPADDVPLGPYGGLASRTLPATGYFHPQQVDGRWWLVDPDGHPYVMVGLAAVAPYDRRKEERDLGPFRDESEWAQATNAQMRAMGFNGTGPWSFDADLQAQGNALNYTVSLYVMYSFAGKYHDGESSLHNYTFVNDVIPVLDPRFEAYAIKTLKERIRPEWVDDPRLVGYFVDNELPWKPDSLRRFLELAPENVNHQQTIAWLVSEAGMTEDQARALGPDDLSDALSSRFLEFIAERYYSIVRKALRAADPNHLYLGSRIHGGYIRRHEVFAAMGRHVDVVSVNYYHRWQPRQKELDQWAAWTGRPYLITEWYAKGADSGLQNESGAGKLVATQEDRGKFYQSFALGLLAHKHCVGWHWYKYKDSPFPGKDSNRGFYTKAFEGYTPLQDAARELNQQVYPLVEYLDAR